MDTDDLVSLFEQVLARMPAEPESEPTPITPDGFPDRSQNLHSLSSHRTDRLISQLIADNSAELFFGYFFTHPQWSCLMNLVNFTRSSLTLYDSRVYHTETVRNRFNLFNSYRYISEAHYRRYHTSLYNEATFKKIPELTDVYNGDCYPLRSSLEAPLADSLRRKIVTNFTQITELSLLHLTIHPSNLYLLLNGLKNHLKSLSLSVVFSFGENTTPDLSQRRSLVRPLLPLLNSMVSLTSLSLTNCPYWTEHLDTALAPLLSQLTVLHLDGIESKLFQILSRLNPAKVERLSLTNCRWASDFDLLYRLVSIRPGLSQGLTHLTIVNCHWGDETDPKGHDDVSLELFQDIVATFRRLLHLEVKLNASVAFHHLFSSLPQFTQLTVFRLHSVNQCFFDAPVIQTLDLPTFTLETLHFLTLDVFFCVEDLYLLAVLFPSLEQLYLDSSRLYFEEMRGWFRLGDFIALGVQAEDEGGSGSDWDEPKVKCPFKEEKEDLLESLIDALNAFPGLPTID